MGRTRRIAASLLQVPQFSDANSYNLTLTGLSPPSPQGYAGDLKSRRENHKKAKGTDEVGIPAPERPTDVNQTDYAVGQDNVRDRIGPLKFDVHNPVFMISGLT